MAEATFCRLRSGEVGLRVVGRVVNPGSIVGVKKQSGEIVERAIDKVVFRGETNDGKPMALATYVVPRGFGKGQFVEDPRRVDDNGQRRPWKRW